MNILNTPQFTGKAKGAKEASGNALDVLGNHKQLTPEQAKALQKLGKIKKDNGGFETLLKETQQKQNPLLKGDAKKLLTGKKVNTANQQLQGKQVTKDQITNLQGQQVTNKQTTKLQKNVLNSQVKKGLANHNKDIMNQVVSPEASQVKMPMKQAQNHQVTPQGETKIARVLKLGQSKNLKATQNNPNVDPSQLGKVQTSKAKAAPGKVLPLNLNGNQVKTKAQTTKTKGMHANPALANAIATNRPMPMVGKQAVVPTASAIASTKLAGKKSPVSKNTKLMDFSTFMKKQNPQSRNRIAEKSSLYQNKNKSMFKAKVEESLPHVVKKQTGQTKLQDVMFNTKTDDMGSNFDQQMNNQNVQVMAKAAPVAVGAEQAAKVLDINTLNSSMGADEVIAKIQDYAIQTKFSNEPQLDFSFKHSELGQVDLTVQKGAGDQLNILINSNSNEGMKFFAQNRGDLLQSLTQAGISVGDFKLDSSGKSNNQNLSQNSNGNGQGTHKEHQSESGQRQEERQRRSDLWDQLKDKEAA